MTFTGPAVSVIVPVYNSQQYLTECLDSILKQTLADFELICVNDGSTDDSSEILHSYAARDYRIRIVDKENSGAGDSRNLGFAKSRGEFVMWLDSDDTFEDGLLDTLYRQITSAGADICFCNYKSYYNDEYAWGTHIEVTPNPFTPIMQAAKLFQLSHPVPWNKMFRAAFLRQLDFKFSPLPSSDDISFVYGSMILAAKIAWVEDSLIRYRLQRQDSTTSRILQKADNAISGYEELYEIMRRYNVVELFMATFHKSLDDVLKYYTRLAPDEKIRKRTSKLFFSREWLAFEEASRDTESVVYKITHNGPLVDFEDDKKDDMSALVNEPAGKPLINIILPVYNAAQYLEKCLQSLMDQTLAEIEVLCINDGSSDNSLEILEQYQQKDARFKVFSQENAGPGSARNLGLANVTAPFLMFCDSDDWYESDMCQRMLETLVNENVDLVICDCNVINTAEKHGRDPGTIDYHHLRDRGFKYLATSVKLSTNVLLWNKILRMDKIKAHDIAFPVGYEHDDNSFIHQYLGVSDNIFFLKERLYNYRLLENSVMGRLFNKKGGAKKFDRFHSSRYTISFLAKHDVLDKNLNFIKKRLLMDSQFAWPFLTDDKDKAQALQLLRENLLLLPNMDGCHDFLLCVYNEQFADAVKMMDASMSSKLTESKYKLFTIVKTKNSASRKILFCNFPLFKKSERNSSYKYYVLGIRIWKKKKVNKQAPADNSSVAFYKLGREILSCKMAVASQYKKDKLVILFDCLYDKNAEAIDAFTLYKYLKQQNVPAKYFILKDNPLCKKLADDKDVIPLFNEYEMLSSYNGFISRASHIITSFGLKTASHEERILKELPFCEYIFIEHGVIFLKRWVTSLYSSKHYDKILVPSPKTKAMYLELGLWDPEDMICSGMPRWDKLYRKEHPRKNILLFFTWRRSFEKHPQEINWYAERIINFINNEHLQNMLAEHDVELSIALHHSILFNKLNINQLANVKIIPTSEISKAIKETDLLITDYSSVFFDFMYLDIPVIFYRFDADLEYSAYEDFESLQDCRLKDGHLYNCFENQEEVLAKIDFYIENDFVLEEEYREINKGFFWDKHSACAELLEYIRRTR